MYCVQQKIAWEQAKLETKFLPFLYFLNAIYWLHLSIKLYRFKVYIQFYNISSLYCTVGSLPKVRYPSISFAHRLCCAGCESPYI